MRWVVTYEKWAEDTLWKLFIIFRDFFFSPASTYLKLEFSWGKCTEVLGDLLLGVILSLVINSLFDSSVWSIVCSSFLYIETKCMEETTAFCAISLWKLLCGMMPMDALCHPELYKGLRETNRGHLIHGISLSLDWVFFLWEYELVRIRLILLSWFL